ncbi:MAG: hypothetical protein LBR42_00925, partial [Candidatus Methanoplasma sp.]|nr:hypothetical protein [Candidatus Methanoplasma sp.]
MNKKIMIIATLVACLAMISLPIAYGISSEGGGEEGSDTDSAPTIVASGVVNGNCTYTLYSDFTAVMTASKTRSLSGIVEIPRSVTYTPEGGSEEAYIVTELGSRSLANQLFEKIIIP